MIETILSTAFYEGLNEPLLQISTLKSFCTRPIIIHNNDYIILLKHHHLIRRYKRIGVQPSGAPLLHVYISYILSILSQSLTLVIISGWLRSIMC